MFGEPTSHMKGLAEGGSARSRAAGGARPTASRWAVHDDAVGRFLERHHDELGEADVHEPADLRSASASQADRHDLGRIAEGRDDGWRGRR